MPPPPRLTHTREAGGARMVNVGGKPVTRRTAEAVGTVRMSKEAFVLLRENAVAKGDVLTLAQVAGIGGAKRVADLVPLCHPLPLDQVEVEVVPDPALPGVHIRASAEATARTGVEMEALAAAAAAALTVYDMLKAVDRTMVIGEVRLRRKTGGTRGDWPTPPAQPEEV